MKKIISKIFIFVFIISILGFIGINNTYSGAIDFGEARGATSKIKDVSMKDGGSQAMDNQISRAGIGIFKTAKTIVGGLLIIYIVYAGANMALSLGTNEGKLSESKRSIWYRAIGLFFLNVPGAIFNALYGSEKTLDKSTASSDFTTGNAIGNIFINYREFINMLNDVLALVEIVVVALAVIILIYNGVNMMMASGDEEKFSDAKNKILWSLGGLVFVGIMEVWKRVFYTRDFDGLGNELFKGIVGIALFFAGPIIILFISIAGYYYITSGGNEERVNKAKNILINVLIAIVLLIGIYSLFGDIGELFNMF